jgi:hypothetical protein
MTGKTHTPFIVRDLIDGALISLALLLERLPPFCAAFARFRDMRFTSGLVLGLPVPEFERLSRDLNAGFIVDMRDIKGILASPAQIVDGRIEFLEQDGTTLVTIECVDATQWEITTEKPELRLALARTSFSR